MLDGKSRGRTRSQTAHADDDKTESEAKPSMQRTTTIAATAKVTTNV